MSHLPPSVGQDVQHAPAHGDQARHVHGGRQQDHQQEEDPEHGGTLGAVERSIDAEISRDMFGREHINVLPPDIQG